MTFVKLAYKEIEPNTVIAIHPAKLMYEKWRERVYGAADLSRSFFMAATTCRSPKPTHRASDGTLEASATQVIVRKGSPPGPTVAAEHLLETIETYPRCAHLDLGPTRSVDSLVKGSDPLPRRHLRALVGRSGRACFFGAGAISGRQQSHRLGIPRIDRRDQTLLHSLLT